MQYGFIRSVYFLITVSSFTSLCEDQNRSVSVQNSTEAKVYKVDPQTILDAPVIEFYKIIDGLKRKRSAGLQNIRRSPYRNQNNFYHERNTYDNAWEKNYQNEKVIKPKKKAKIIFHFDHDGIVCHDISDTETTRNYFEEENQTIENLNSSVDEENYLETAGNTLKEGITETEVEHKTVRQPLEQLLDDINVLIDQFKEASGHLTKNVKTSIKNNSFKDRLRWRKNKILPERTSDWNSWSEWSQCSVSCGQGVRVRSRFHKYTKNTPAELKEIQEKKCIMPDCPTFNLPRLIAKIFTRSG